MLSLEEKPSRGSEESLLNPYLIFLNTHFINDETKPNFPWWEMVSYCLP
jgi:hypothetical protein